MRRLTVDPDQLRLAQEAVRRLTADPDQIRRAEEAVRRLTADPDQIRRAEEAVRRLTADPDQIRRAEEAVRRLTADRELTRRLQQTLDELGSPAGLSQLNSALESLEVLDQTDIDLSLGEEAEVGDAFSQLRTAVEIWNADAGDVSILIAGSDSDSAFGWLDALPTVVQLKLWLSTIDVLNGLLLLVGFLSPSSVPMGVVLATEVLIRLNRALLERLDTKGPEGD
jgi:hypothetical protein